MKWSDRQQPFQDLLKLVSSATSSFTKAKAVLEKDKANQEKKAKAKAQKEAQAKKKSRHSADIAECQEKSNLFVFDLTKCRPINERAEGDNK
eukprot:5837152-Lingulodinium_polyedra.AAC.1